MKFNIFKLTNYLLMSEVKVKIQKDKLFQNALLDSRQITCLKYSQIFLFFK